MDIFIGIGIAGGMVSWLLAILISDMVSQHAVQKIKMPLTIVALLPLGIFPYLYFTPHSGDALTYLPTATFIFGSPLLSFFTAFLLGKQSNKNYYILAVINFMFTCFVFAAGTYVLVLEM